MEATLNRMPIRPTATPPWSRVATYNEIENLPRLVEEIFASRPTVDMLVIDDNSPDGTGQWCDRRRAEDPRVHCLHRAGKLGLGTAIIAGMQYAIEHGYRYMLNMDADFSHHPRYLPDLLAGMEPRGRPAGRRDDRLAVHSRRRRRGLAAAAAADEPRGEPLRPLLLGLRPKDCSGAFRCYRTSLLARLDFDAIRSRGYSFQEEILWHLKRLGGTVRRNAHRLRRSAARGLEDQLAAKLWRHWASSSCWACAIG